MHTGEPSASAHSVPSSCQQPFGAGCSNRRNDDRGRFAGAGSIKPSRTRIRCTVRGEGTAGWPARTSRNWIDRAPLSHPCSISLARADTMAVTTSDDVWFGLIRGRLERGSSPANPSTSTRARYR